MKILFLFITIFLAVSINISNVRAFSSVLGASKIAPDCQLYIDGILIEDPNKEIMTKSNKPTFFGYTFDNVEVQLDIQNGLIVRTATSDVEGYWLYQLDTGLDPEETYTLFMNLTDASGVSTSTFLAATFKVPPPDVLGETSTSISTPTPSLHHLNYVTIPIIVFGITLMLILLYLAVRWKKE